MKKPTVKEKVAMFNKTMEGISEGTIGVDGIPPSHTRITCPECADGGPHRIQRPHEPDRAVCRKCNYAIPI